MTEEIVSFDERLEALLAMLDEGVPLKPIFYLESSKMRDSVIAVEVTTLEGDPIVPLDLCEVVMKTDLTFKWCEDHWVSTSMEITRFQERVAVLQRMLAENKHKLAKLRATRRVL